MLFTSEIDQLMGLAEVYEGLGKEADKNGLLRRIKVLEAKRARAKADVELLGASKVEKFNTVLNKTKSELSFSVVREYVPKLQEQKDDKGITKTVVKPIQISPEANEFPQILQALVDVASVSFQKIELSFGPHSEISRAEPESTKIGIAIRFQLPPQ